jgi:phospholipid/cholesterol/gamma-HCH transport system substrate-binding protein
VKNNRLNYVIVGSFVLVVLIGLVASVAALTGRTGATDDYYAIYKNVTGVEFGTRVLYEGFHIGQVEQVSPMEEDGRVKFKVDFSVKEGWKVPADSRAEIVSSGLLAAVTINLKAGEKTDLLKPGARIESVEAANILQSVSSLADEVRQLTETDVKPMIAQISKAVGGFTEIMGESGGAVAKDVQSILQNLSASTPDIVDNIENFSIRLNDGAEQLNRMLSKRNVEAFDQIVGNLQTTADNMKTLTDELGRTRTDLDALLKRVDGLFGNVETLVSDNRLDVDRSIVEMRHAVSSVARHIEAINQNLEGASRNMQEFSRQIRQNPGLLLGGTPPADKAAAK